MLVEQRGGGWSSVEQRGATWRRVEQRGATWRRVEQRGAAWSNVGSEVNNELSNPAATLPPALLAEVSLMLWLTRHRDIKYRLLFERVLEDY